MAYTTRQLINEAFYLSGIVARGLQTVSGEQINDGLFRLNGFLAMKGADIGMIPYYDVYDFTSVIGQEVYFIPNLLEIETLVFYIGTVRYDMRYLTREDYFQPGRIEDIESLPYSWHLERTFGGSNIYIYYTPIQAYPMTLTGKFALSQTTLNQDLSLVYDKFYLEYLMYGLALYLCEYYGIVPAASLMKTFDSFEQYNRDISPMDLTMRKLEYFDTRRGFNYADAIIGLGWRPNS